jgi:hypothetical protein
VLSLSKHERRKARKQGRVWIALRQAQGERYLFRASLGIRPSLSANAARAGLDPAVPQVRFLDDQNVGARLDRSFSRRFMTRLAVPPAVIPPVTGLKESVRRAARSWPGDEAN